MTDQRAPAILVFSLLFAAILLTFTVFGMLAPLLVGLAAEFQTSVAVAGQLAAATSIAWAIAAPLVGPCSYRPDADSAGGLGVSPSMVLRLDAGISPSDRTGHGCDCA